MEGILYLRDENNNKVAVQISYERYGSIIDDLIDRLIIASRKEEESYPMEEVISELEEKGNLNKYVQD